MNHFNDFNNGTKNVTLDIMLICKGWYNDKHESVKDALKAYQKQYAGLEESREPSDAESFDFATMHCFYKLKNHLDACELMRRIVKDYETSRWNSGCKFEMSHSYLLDTVIRIINMLQVKHENGETLIDTSAYKPFGIREENNRLEII